MRTIPLLIAAGALAIPGAAVADPPAGHGPGSHGPGTHGKHLAKGHAKPRTVVAKGTVVSVDATAGTVTIHVTRANHHGQALVGTDATFSIPAGRVVAADRNADGKVDLADVNAGDNVLVQARLASDATSPYAARRLVDQSSPATEDAGSSDTPDSTGTTSDSTGTTAPATS